MKYLMHIAMSALVCLGAASRSSATTAPLVLVADGQPKALIVLPAKDVASDIESAAARILADHVFQMSGVKLPVLRKTG